MKHSKHVRMLVLLGAMCIFGFAVVLQCIGMAADSLESQQGRYSETGQESAERHLIASPNLEVAKIESPSEFDRSHIDLFLEKAHSNRRLFLFWNRVQIEEGWTLVVTPRGQAVNEIQILEIQTGENLHKTIIGNTRVFHKHFSEIPAKLLLELVYDDGHIVRIFVALPK